MVIIVYSSETDKTILNNIGAPDYSYYFVLKKYRAVLCKLAHVMEVQNPETDVDVIYKSCRSRGEACLFLSFSPPFKTVTSLECPTISVFAWEFMTIPTDGWGNDPRNDWRYVFDKHGCAITHSSFAVKAVKNAMGQDFPVWSIPAPVWEHYQKLYRKGQAYNRSRGLDLSIKGTLIDINGCNIPYLAEEQREDFVTKRSFSIRDDQLSVPLQLKGVIYTSVFNPGDGRKNWEDLVKGFIWAFRELTDVTLVLKIVFNDVVEAQRIIMEEIYKLTPFKCRVIILHGYLDDRDYQKLIQATTYVVNTAHGEGQCLPLMEYMSAGKPAIAPIHSAMADYISEKNTFVVQSSVERTHWPSDPRYALRTMRYRIDWESLFKAYLESYQVALNDPARYARMSVCALESLKHYCSQAIVRKKLKIVFRERGLAEGFLFSSQMKMRHAASRFMKRLHEKYFQ